MLKNASAAQHAPRDDTALATRLDSSLDTLWVSLQPAPGRPLNFSPELLDAFERLLDRIEESRWHWLEDSREGRLRYLVLTSSHPRHFALGGDLAYFQSCIEKGNAGALRAYSMRCLELVRRIFSAAHEVTTVSLVQGRALGGGFETALSASHLIAERGAEFGFPEIAFGTFPCTGGMTLLANRIGLRRAAAFMRNARIHTAADLHALGLVDELCEPGEGPAAVQRFIAEHRRRYNARMALQRAEARMGVFDIVEMRTVVEDWVATAMALSAEERRVLDTLVRMQAADAGVAAIRPPTVLKRSA
jgi:DSF synthase